jgi:hypothetical protein
MFYSGKASMGARRFVCVLFPRLGVQLAVRGRPELAGRPVILIAGAGDEALVAECSPEAAARGLLAGMSAGQARGRCPGAAFLPDNAGACLDELGRIASILRTRATSLVAVEGRSHMVAAVADEDEARAVVALARAWSGWDVKGGLGATRAGALEAARSARCGGLLGAERERAGADEPVPWRSEGVYAAEFRVEPRKALSAGAGMKRAAARLDALLAGRGESFREVTLLWEGAGSVRVERVRTARPLHRANEGVEALRPAVARAVAEGARGLRVELGRLGPAVRVEACAAGVPGGGARDEGAVELRRAG